MDSLTQELINIGKAADEISELVLSSRGATQEEIDLISEKLKAISKKYDIPMRGMVERQTHQT